MTIKEIISIMESANPYPEDIFPEPTKKDWHNIGKFLHKHGKNPDRIFAKFGRMVWNNAINQLKELTED